MTSPSRYQIWPVSNMGVLLSWGNGQTCAGYAIWDVEKGKRVTSVFDPGKPALFHTLAQAVNCVRELEF